MDLTVLATARALLAKAGESNYTATIIVDGLRTSETGRFASSLRQLHIQVRKVRGMQDEKSALLRVADSLCGFARDYLEGQEYTKDFEWVFETKHPEANSGKIKTPVVRGNSLSLSRDPH